MSSQTLDKRNLLAYQNNNRRRSSHSVRSQVSHYDELYNKSTIWQEESQQRSGIVQLYIALQTYVKDQVARDSTIVSKYRAYGVQGSARIGTSNKIT